MATQIGADDCGSDALTASQLDYNSTISVDPNVISSPAGQKVKCNEEHPICGHCHRLRLVCTYDSSASPDSLARIEKPRQKSSLARQRNQTSTTRVAAVQDQSLPNQRSHVGITGRVQNVSLEAEPLHDDDSTALSLVPSTDIEDPIRGQLLDPENWELELLGEDSLCTNLPILSSFFAAQHYPPYEHVMPPYNMAQPFSSSLPMNDIRSDPSSATQKDNMIAAAPVSFRNSDQTHFSPLEEVTLLRHFVDFAVPPILIGVEPRWHKSRNALLRLSKSHYALRLSICAFSALSLEESSSTQPSQATQSSDYYSALAVSELEKLFDGHSGENAGPSSYEAILGSIFFLAYVGLIVSKAPKSPVDLLDRAHTLLSQSQAFGSTLSNQLQIWLKLLDAKVVSAGGSGFHLYTNPDNLDLDPSTGDGEQASTNVNFLETEDILFNSLNQQAYSFYLQVLNFSGRIARLDKWHRSRGSVEDELEVMLAAEKVLRDLNALWARRPAIIDLADQGELVQYMAPGLATKVLHHLRTYMANFQACFIHLQRVAYAHLQAIPQIRPAVARIVGLSRMTLKEGQSLSVSMLWPLMMAACEAEQEDTRHWIINCIDGMEAKVGNATRTAKLVRAIVERQKCGQRADARTVMHDTFEEVFAII
ncbi:fungal-specific transcription factor domain-containing protein [Aspergillus californicus]